MLSFQSLIWVWAIVKSNSVPRTSLIVFLLMVFTWVHHHSLRSDQYFCLVLAIYESIFLEHLNTFVVEPIDDILIFSMFEEIYIGHLALMLKTWENHLCVIMKYVFWMFEVTFSLWFTCNCWKMSPWIQEEFSLFLGNHLELVMHVRIILEMIGCCLHLLGNFLCAQKATDWFIQQREEVQDLHYLLSRSPNKISVVFHCNNLLLCNCLWAIAILLIFWSLTM
jgi:hypothetical protein